jgi:hypothetical protein
LQRRVRRQAAALQLPARSGKERGGFALIAFPAKYGSTGIKTFIVNDDDTVFQNDLGADTRTIAEKTTIFNPGWGWSQAKI